jgi:hypothetical protein
MRVKLFDRNGKGSETPIQLNGATKEDKAAWKKIIPLCKKLYLMSATRFMLTLIQVLATDKEFREAAVKRVREFGVEND